MRDGVAYQIAYLFTRLTLLRICFFGKYRISIFELNCFVRIVFLTIVWLACVDMSTALRLKRKATKPAIIDSSDSESDEEMGCTSSSKSKSRKPANKSEEYVPKKRVKREGSQDLHVKRQPNIFHPPSAEEVERREKSSDDKENRRMNQQKRSSIEGTRRPWNIFELLCETEHIDSKTSRNIVDLFENENTIPFICRYRRELIGYMTPERLRDIKTTYTEIVTLRKKAETIISTIEKENAVVPREVKDEIMCAKTKEELEFIYAPYKAASKGSLADRAKALGLEQPAEDLLLGFSPPVDFRMLVNKSNEDLNTVEKVKTGICNILIYKLSKNTDILEELRRL